MNFEEKKKNICDLICKIPYDYEMVSINAGKGDIKVMVRHLYST